MGLLPPVTLVAFRLYCDKEEGIMTTNVLPLLLDILSKARQYNTHVGTHTGWLFGTQRWFAHLNDVEGLDGQCHTRPAIKHDLTLLATPWLHPTD